MIKNVGLRRFLRLILPSVLIPAVAIFGTVIFDENRHIFVSLMVAFLTCIFFISGFERKETGTRRTVMITLIIALSVTGRFIPIFKPISALTVIGAIYFGKEAGFMIGSMSALVSNFYFGQGPWTPFQMLSWGLIGLLAGLISGSLKKNRTVLLLFGVLSGIFYSLVMDVWTVLWYSGGFSAELYLATVIASLPHTVSYAVSNFAFLFFLAKPLGEKLERVVAKYKA